jgi:hypothetical protein
MDQPDTSHPYYWSGFSIIGDGAAVLIPSQQLLRRSGQGGGQAARR